jgi:RNA recognition motif-containing protein
MNIFISNLSFRVKNEDLKQIFEEYGEVSSAKVITDKLTGRSRGFGFVEMNRDEEAQAAIEELNGADFDGKVISVSEARPRPEGEQRRSGGNRSFGNRGGDGERGYRNRY